MSNQNLVSTVIVTWVALLSLLMLLSAGPAKAQNRSANYTFLVASGFLCDPDASPTCPAAVTSANGDSYEMSGAGTFDSQTKSVKAAGTFAHKSPDGSTLDTGVWIAGELVSFDSYGTAPGALMHQGRAFGSTRFGPKRLPMSSYPIPTGGLAVFRIRLLPISGASKTAVLQANCALGDVPRERSVEGIRLAFEKNGSEFSEEVSGRVMFLSMQPEVSAPSRTPQQKAEPDPVEPPRN